MNPTGMLRPIAPKSKGNKRPPKIPCRRKISFACFACKERKCKCGEGMPCERCVERKTDCIYDKSSDKRRRTLLNRKLEELEKDNDLLIQLVNTLRETDNCRVFQLLNVIRSNASLEEIKVHIAQYVPNEIEKTPELLDAAGPPSQIQESDYRSQRRVLDAERLSDMPLWKVPASPWTTVTDDNDFVSHLISLWFTWHHPYFNWIDRDLFIQDMELRDVDRVTYCSPFLVNIILADACAYSDYPESFADASDLASRGQHFYGEAKRLYEADGGRFTLTTVQGLCVLWACASLMGKDRRGWIYKGQLAYAMRELEDELADEKNASKYTQQAVSTTFWGIYNFSSAISMLNYDSPLITIPQMPYPEPFASEDARPDMWRPYPLAHANGVPAHTTRLLKALSDLSRITYDFTAEFFNSNHRYKDTPFSKIQEKAGKLCTRLQEWKTNIPVCLMETHNDTPHALSLHIYYCTLTMTILGFIEEKASDEGLRLSNYQHARNQRFSTARRVAQLMDFHRASWGIDRAPAVNIQCISVAQRTLVQHLDNCDNRKASVSLRIAANAFARRWALGKEVLRSWQT